MAQSNGTVPFGLHNMGLSSLAPSSSLMMDRCTNATTLDSSELMYSELWHACAGPLVSLPCKGSRVVYFPQGHMEQVAASMKQGAEQQMPVYDLPSQIMCRVADLSLHADRETDEVFAQFTLVPLPQHLEKSFELDVPCPPKLATHMFCKTLTISDTSTHGGFSVPRRAADDCFPPLDYTQQRPSQELVAKDVHGVEWKFRHIYRGQPRRHLLTTGWSTFVSTKKLIAGDSVLFLRRENGDLWLGIRRGPRPPCNNAMSVLPSHSMHMGVLAAAAHALATKSMFNVYYNPRTSPAEFVIAHQKYRKAFAHSLSVGMRFKMRFESEDGTERRYTGTITGVGDVDPDRWRDSRWRCLKVNWDEHSNNDRCDYVSPWEIEPFLATGSLDLPMASGLKRFWSSLPSSTGDYGHSGVVTSSRDPFTRLRFSKVLQVQEAASLSPSLRDDIFKGAAKSSILVPKTNDPFAELKRLRKSEENRCGAVARGSMAEFSAPNEKLHERGADLIGSSEGATGQAGMNAWNSLTPSLLKPQQPLAGGGLHPPSVPLLPPKKADQATMSTTIWPSLLSHSVFPHIQHSQMDALKSLLTSCQPEVTATPGLSTSLLSHLSHKSLLQLNAMPTDNIQGKPYAIAGEPAKESNQMGGNVRLFGFSLRENAAGDGKINDPRVHDKPSSHVEVQSNLCGAKSSAILPACEGKDITSPYISECHTSSRNRIKVLKKGHTVGRSIDLSKFNGYPELISTLEKLFNMEGELSDPKTGWQVTYTDKEGDTMLVGDDPWQDFVDIVGKICILTREELQAVSLGALATSAHSRSSENPLVNNPSKSSDSSPPTAFTLS